MAQTAGIVVSYKLKDYDEKSVLFMSVNKAKFRKPILPNENICFEVTFLNKVRDVYKFNGVATLGGVTMNGEQIYSQAIEEIEKLEQAIRDGAFETPIWGMIG